MSVRTAGILTDKRLPCAVPNNHLMGLPKLQGTNRRQQSDKENCGNEMRSNCIALHNELAHPFGLQLPLESRLLFAPLNWAECTLLIL